MRLVITVVEVKEGKATKVGALEYMLGSVSEGLKTRPSFLAHSLTVKRGPKMERHAYVPLGDVREYFTNITRPLPDTRTFASAIRNKKPVPGCRAFIEYLYSDKFDHGTLIEYGNDSQVERLYGVRKETIGIAHSDAWVAKHVPGIDMSKNSSSGAKDGVTEGVCDNMWGHVEPWTEDGLEGQEEMKIKVSISKLVSKIDKTGVHDRHDNISPECFVRGWMETKSGESEEDWTVVSQNKFIVAIKSYLDTTLRNKPEVEKRIISVRENGEWSVKDMVDSSEFIDSLESDNVSMISFKEFDYRGKLLLDIKVVPEHRDFSPFPEGLMEAEETFMRSSTKGWENPVFNGLEESKSSPNMIDMHARKDQVKLKVLSYVCGQGQEVDPGELFKLRSTGDVFHLDAVESVLRNELETPYGRQEVNAITYMGNGGYAAGYERFMSCMRSGETRAALVVMNIYGSHLYTIMFEIHDTYGFGKSWSDWYEDVLLNAPTVVNMINEYEDRRCANGIGRKRGRLQDQSMQTPQPTWGRSPFASRVQSKQDTLASGTAGHIKSMYVDEQGKVMVMSGGQWAEYKGNPMDVLMSLVANKG